MMRYFLCLGALCSVLIGCTPEPTIQEIIDEAMNFVASDAELENVESIIAVADCVSPNGNYTTEVHSFRDEYVYFKQVYTYRPTPFEAVVTDATHVFTMNADSARFLPAENSSIDFIKGHEFHEIVINLTSRFRNWRNLKATGLDGKAKYSIEATDISGNMAELYFDRFNKQFYAYAFKNPMDTTETLVTRFDDWRDVQGYMLPDKVTIEQGDDVFSFDYREVTINSPDFQKIEINR